MKPDWKDAPADAQFLAMDEDGAWYWYEKSPTKTRIGDWKPADGSGIWFAGTFIPNWNNTLEPRP